jgi:hypothetical protein
MEARSRKKCKQMKWYAGKGKKKMENKIESARELLFEY